MNLKNSMVLAEDNSEHSNSLNVEQKSNSELNYTLNVFPYITLIRTHRKRVTVCIVEGFA
jgi:hypothetical protein